MSPSCHPENAIGISELIVVETNSILKEELEIFSRVLSPTIVSLKESGEWSLNRFVKSVKMSTRTHLSQTISTTNKYLDNKLLTRAAIFGQKS